MRRTALNALACSAAFLLAGPAWAQTLPEIGRTVTQGAQIEDAIERASAQRGQEPQDEQDIDGEAGIYVLKKADIFFVSGTAGLAYSSNPLRTVDDVGGSGSAEAALSAGMQTQVGRRIDIGAALNFETTRFFKDFAPSNTVASGTVSVGSGIGKTPLYIGLSGFGGWNFDKDMTSATSFYGASVQLGAQLPLGKRFLVQPLLAVSRVLGETKENDQISAGARLGVTTRFGPVLVTASASASRFWYDDFFEDVTFVPRRDWQYEGALTAAYPIRRNLLMAASVRYTERNSSFFLSNFESVDAGAAFTLRLRF